MKIWCGRAPEELYLPGGGVSGGSLHNQRGQLVPAQGLCGDWRQRGQGKHCGRLHYEDTQCQVRVRWILGLINEIIKGTTMA